MGAGLATGQAKCRACSPNRNGSKMNKLDQMLDTLVRKHAKNCGLNQDHENQMAKEISILVMCGYNTRAELISLLKKSLVA
jgi:hypothetical protein